MPNIQKEYSVQKNDDKHRKNEENLPFDATGAAFLFVARFCYPSDALSVNISPSGSTRRAPPFPVTFTGVHGGFSSGAFISSSTSGQGIDLSLKVSETQNQNK